jgi:predicted nicotinamide N-methyase
MAARATNGATIPGKEMVLYELNLYADMGVGIGGDRWPAAETFCDCILDSNYCAFFTSLFNNKRVVELGAGNGMAGLLVGKTFPNVAEVVVTDAQDHLGLMERNIAMNSTTVRNVTCQVLDWLQPQAAELGKFDIVLALECIYRENLYGPLIDSLDCVCHDDTVIFLGLTRQFLGKGLFFEQLAAAGFDYTMVPHECTVPSTRRKEGSEDVGLFVVQRKKTTDRLVLMQSCSFNN